MNVRVPVARMVRVGIAAMFLVSLLAARDLALPGRTLACSCRAPQPADIAEIANFGPEYILFEGVVTEMGNGMDEFGHSFGDLTVTRLYKGELPSNFVRVEGGGGGDCTMSLRVGQRLFAVGSFDGTTLSPGLCSHFGDPAAPETQPFIAAAVAAFGPGVVPAGGGDPEATSPPLAAPALVSRDLALPLVFGGLIVIVVGLFGAIALVARRPRGTA